MRVLLVEDEELIADAIKVCLQRNSFHVDWIDNGLDAAEAIATSQFDLIILDLGLPGQDGLSVLRHVREHECQTPILILTARESIHNRIEGLDGGADDYLVKPFDMDELMARCRALIRRSNGHATPILSHGRLELDPAAHKVRLDGRSLNLQPMAFRLLHILLERRGRVISKNDLMESLYGWEENAESNVLEVYVSQIRRQIDPGLIRTIRGVGYTIENDSLS